jgi:hypothetical protein
MMQKWKPMGIRVITLMLDDPPTDTKPVTVVGAGKWKTKYNLLEVGVMADPTFSMVMGGSVGTPQMTIVNPRTMQVTYVGGVNNAAVEALAKQNGAK